MEMIRSDDPLGNRDSFPEVVRIVRGYIGISQLQLFL